MGSQVGDVEATRQKARDALAFPPVDGSGVSEEHALTSLAHSALLIELHLASIATTVRDIQRSSLGSRSA
jgi:hypothetical protein